ncbi:MAG TPA: hypothetical protein DCL21_06460 [Alphaproteobacteria bacterium]|nr:hypothetical protein [Alphaproteobacteria bacterium]
MSKKSEILNFVDNSLSTIKNILDHMEDGDLKCTDIDIDLNRNLNDEWSLLLCKYHLHKYIEASNNLDEKAATKHCYEAHKIYNDPTFKYEAEIDKLRAQASLESLKLHVHSFINDERGIHKHADLSTIWNKMRVAGYCKGDIDIYYHHDFAIIGLTPDIVDSVFTPIHAKRALQAIEETFLLHQRNLPRNEIQDFAGKLNNIFLDYKTPYNLDQVLDYLLSNTDDETLAEKLEITKSYL